MAYLSFHCHSVYSKQDAVPEPLEIAKKNKELGNDAFVITDHGDLGGWIKAYQAAQQTGLQFIPGCEMYLQPDNPKFWLHNKLHSDIETDEKATKYFHLVAVAKNQQGVKSLIALYNTHKDYYGKPLITKENLFKYHDGLVVLTSCVSGEPLYYLNIGEEEKARQSLLSFKNVFGEDVYCEVQHHNLDAKRFNEYDLYKKLVELARELNIPLIATNDSHYVNKEDRIAHNIYKCITKDNYRVDPVTFQFDNGFDGEGYHIKTEEEVRESLLPYDFLTKEELDSCVNNTQVLRHKCEVTHFPQAIPLSNKMEELRALVEKGFLEKRKGTPLEEESRKRLEYELNVIDNMHFSEYFINVYNILARARELGLLVGPARGSAGGSEICYLLNIVKIDPLKNKLIFERFLNPARASMPDIDCDIQSTSPVEGYDNGKDLLIESLSKDKFPFAGQIVNEMRYSTLTLFKKVASCFGLNFAEVNRVTTDDEIASVYLQEDVYTGWIPTQLAKLKISYTPKWEAFTKMVPFCYRYGGNEKGDHAHGLLYTNSIHASGVIFYPYNDKNVLPKSKQGVIYRGHDLEAMGYIKYDLLGLESLDPINHFIPIIEKDLGKKFQWEENTNDPKVWAVFQRADTDFVFQFASNGMKRALKTVRPTNISQLAELNALYRPGPINAGIFERYLKNTFTEDEKVVGKFLKEEFGEQHSDAMIFQEDILKIVQKMAGFSLSEADLVRRAIQRKEADKMASYKKKFIEGFDKEKYGNIAEDVWTAIDAFAAYCFNKSHAVAYGTIAYWTAYLVAYHKNEYLSYLLNIDVHKKEIISYLCRNSVRIIFPTVETQNTEFVLPEDKNVLLLPTASPTHEKPVQYLLNLTSLKKQMIIKRGLFDNFCPDRQGLRALFSELDKKKIKDLDPNYKELLEECTTFDETLNILSSLNLLDYEPEGNIYKIDIIKPRSKKKITIDTNIHSHNNVTFNSREDIRSYGMVRGEYADKLWDYPFDDEILKNNLSLIELPQVATKNCGNFIFRKIVANDPNYKMVSSNFGYTKSCIFQDAKRTKNSSTRVRFIFADDAIDIYIKQGQHDLLRVIKALEKNSPVDVTLALNVYVYLQNKARNMALTYFDGMPNEQEVLTSFSEMPFEQKFSMRKNITLLTIAEK